MKILFYLIATLILLNSCNIKEVEIGNIDGVNIKKLTKEQLSLELNVPVKNNNNFAFTISDINIDLSLGNVNLGKINKTQKIKIPANSNQIQNVGVDIKFDNLSGNPLSFISSVLKNKVELKAKGYIKVRKFIFTKKFNIDENQAVKLFKKGLF